MEGDAKVYGVIYVFATSRLVYVDAIPDMTAESVFKSVTQFVAQNGLPRMFYSDNGKQFIKMKNDRQKYLEEMSLKTTRPGEPFPVATPDSPLSLERGILRTTKPVHQGGAGHFLP